MQTVQKALFDEYVRSLALEFPPEIYYDQDSDLDELIIKKAFYQHYIDSFHNFMTVVPLDVLNNLLLLLPYPDPGAPNYRRFVDTLVERFPDVDDALLDIASRPLIDLVVANTMVHMLRFLIPNSRLPGEYAIKILTIIEMNLKNRAQNGELPQLLKKYEKLASEEWWKVLGYLSQDYHAKVEHMFKVLLDETITTDAYNFKSIIYFNAMNFIHSDKQKQTQILTFHLKYLEYTQKRNDPELIRAQLQALTRFLRQADFSSWQNTGISDLNHMYDIIDKHSRDKALKATSIQVLAAFLVRGPKVIFSRLKSFLERRILQHLSTKEKCGYSLMILSMILRGADNPYPFDVEQTPNYRCGVRNGEPRELLADRLNLVFKHLVKKANVKLIYPNFRERLVEIVVQMAALSLEFAFEEMLVQCCKGKHGNEMQVVGFMALAKILEPAGAFRSPTRGVELREYHVTRASEWLRDILAACEKSIGVQVLQHSFKPLIVTTNLKDVEDLITINDDWAEVEERRRANKNRSVDMRYENYIRLLVSSTVENSEDAMRELLVTQKNSWTAEFSQLMMNRRISKSSQGLLPVYRAAVCAVASVLPDQTLTDYTESTDDVFIGKILLHPDFDLAQYASLSLQKMMRNHTILFDQVLTALREYACTFSIHKTAPIATLLRQMSLLVDIWADNVDCRNERFESAQVLESVLELLLKLDAVSLSFFCHTSIDVRDGALKLCRAVHRARLPFVVYLDIPDDQANLPTSLYELLQDKSEDLILASRKNFEGQKDNLFHTVKLYDPDDREAIKTYPETNDFFTMVIAPDNDVPWSSIIFSLVEAIEKLSVDMESEYFAGLKFETCTLLMQDSWIGADRHTLDKGVVGSMCIALIPLMGFTDNGLDYEEFYDSLWSQMWSLYKRKEDGGALTNTMILALHCANRTRLFKLFISVKSWFDSKQQDPLGSKLKGSKKAELMRENNDRFQMFVRVLLSLTYRDRLTAFFKEEVEFLQDENNNMKPGVTSLHAEMVKLLMIMDTEYIVQWCSYLSHVWRDVARLNENIARSLLDSGINVLMLEQVWSTLDRNKALDMVKTWSTILSPNADSHLYNQFLNYGKQEATQEHRESVQKALETLENQAFRAGAAVLSLGRILTEESLLAKWFDWAIKGQHWEAPTLKKLLLNHYGFLLPHILRLLYKTRTRSDVAKSRMLFGVIAETPLPVLKQMESIGVNVDMVVTNLIVFCLYHTDPNVSAKTKTPTMISRDLFGYSPLERATELVKYDMWRTSANLRFKCFSHFFEVCSRIVSDPADLQSIVKFRAGLQCKDFVSSKVNGEHMADFISKVIPRELLPGVLGVALDSWQIYYNCVMEVKSTMESKVWELQFNILANWIYMTLPFVRGCPLHRFPQEDNWNENFLNDLFSFTVLVALQDHPLVLKMAVEFWHQMITSRSTILSMSDTTPENIRFVVRFLLDRIVEKYDEFQRADSPVIQETVCTPERAVDICEFILLALYETHSKEVRETLLEYIGIGCSLGPLENLEADVDNMSFKVGGEKYAPLVGNVVTGWLSTIMTANYESMKDYLPVLLGHVFLFIDDDPSEVGGVNFSRVLLSNLFIALLPKEVTLSQQFLHVSLWIRNNIRLKFGWEAEADPKAKRKVVYNTFDDLVPYFVHNDDLFVEDAVRMMFDSAQLINSDITHQWGNRILEWANVRIHPDNSREILLSTKFLQLKALRVFKKVCRPRDVATVLTLNQVIVDALAASYKNWENRNVADRYTEVDMDMKVVLAGIDCLIALIESFEDADWSKPVFRTVCVLMWVSFSLVQCRVALIQEKARKLLANVMNFKIFHDYMVAFPPGYDPNTRKPEPGRSAYQFWRPGLGLEFEGLQSRLVTGAFVQFGVGAPLAVNHDVAEILAKSWAINCDFLNDRNIHSKEAANLGLMLPYIYAHVLWKSDDLIDVKDPRDKHTRGAEVVTTMYQCISQNKRLTQKYKKTWNYMSVLGQARKAKCSPRWIRDMMIRLVGETMNMHFPHQAASVARALETTLRGNNPRVKEASVEIIIIILQKLNEIYRDNIDVKKEMFRVFNNSIEIALTLTGDDNIGVNAAALRLAGSLASQNYASDGAQSRILNNCHPAFRDIELSDNVERAIHELKEINVSSRQLLTLKPSYKNPEKQVDRILQNQEQRAHHAGVDDIRDRGTSPMMSPSPFPGARRGKEPKVQPKLDPAIQQEVASDAPTNISVPVVSHGPRSANLDKRPVLGGGSEGPVGDLTLFLETPDYFNKLLRFSKSLGKGHLVEYYMGAETFRMLSQKGSIDWKKQREMAKHIIETYFLPESDGFLTPLQTMTRHEAMKNFVDTKKKEMLDGSIFLRSQEEIKIVIQNEVFPLLIESEVYQKLVKSGDIVPPDR